MIAHILQTIGQALLAWITYPGVWVALALGALAGRLLAGRSGSQQVAALALGLVSPAGWRGEAALHHASVLLAGAGLALLPFPLHPVGAAAAADSGLWLWAWAAFEAAFLLPLLPALASGYPPLVRAAMREAQPGVAGRALLWLALAVGLLLHDTWGLVGATGHSPLVAHGLAALAALVAFPATIGSGAFAPASGLLPGGATYGLNRQHSMLARTAQRVRQAALLGAALVALLPVGVLPTLPALVLLVLLFAGGCWLLRWLEQRATRLALPDALRICWWRALPLGAIAVVYLGLVTG